MLAFVPVAFDLYRPLKPRLRWAMQCLVSFADHAGRCFPSIRTFAYHAGVSKSAAGRDLAALTEAGCVTRKRRHGGVYVYQIAQRFLPRWAKEQVSQAWNRQHKALQARNAAVSPGGVPDHGTKENCSFQGTAFLLRIDPLKRLNRRSRAGPGNMDSR